MVNIKVSTSGDFYYVDHPEAWFWLSTKRYEGSIPDSAPAAHLSGFVHVIDDITRKFFHREYLPFVFWIIPKQPKLVTIEYDDPRFLDYLQASNRLDSRKNLKLPTI